MLHTIFLWEQNKQYFRVFFGKILDRISPGNDKLKVFARDKKCQSEDEKRAENRLRLQVNFPKNQKAEETNESCRQVAFQKNGKENPQKYPSIYWQGFLSSRICRGCCWRLECDSVAAPIFVMKGMLVKQF